MQIVRGTFQFYIGYFGGLMSGTGHWAKDTQLIVYQSSLTNPIPNTAAINPNSLPELPNTIAKNHEDVLRSKWRTRNAKCLQVLSLCKKFEHRIAADSCYDDAAEF